MHFKVLSIPENGIVLSLKDIMVTFLPASVSVHGLVGASLGIEINRGLNLSVLIGQPADQISNSLEGNPV